MSTENKIAPEEKALNERLEVLREAKAQRELQRDLEAKKRELAALELGERFEVEIGAQGVDFRIINTDVGLVVVRLGDFVTFKRFDAIPLEKKTAEDVIAFVTPSVVYPTRAEFGQLVTARPGIAYTCALAIQQMFSGKRDEATGK
jgi:hypothetical protein